MVVLVAERALRVQALPALYLVVAERALLVQALPALYLVVE